MVNILATRTKEVTQIQKRITEIQTQRVIMEGIQALGSKDRLWSQIRGVQQKRNNLTHLSLMRLQKLFKARKDSSRQLVKKTSKPLKKPGIIQINLPATLLTLLSKIREIASRSTISMMIKMQDGSQNATMTIFR